MQGLRICLDSVIRSARMTGYQHYYREHLHGPVHSRPGFQRYPEGHLATARAPCPLVELATDGGNTLRPGLRLFELRGQTQQGCFIAIPTDKLHTDG